MAIRPPAPLQRADSGPPVSARDASYWMAVACSLSSSRSPAVPSSWATTSSRSVDAHTFLSNMRTDSSSSFLDDRNKNVEQRDYTLPHPDASFSSLYDSKLVAARPQPARSRTTIQDSHSDGNRSIMVAEEVYEYQRYHMVLGWGSIGHLLPLDPDKYMRVVPHCRPIRKRSSIHGREAPTPDVLLEWAPSATFPDIPLPDPPILDKPQTSKQRSRSAATFSQRVPAPPGNCILGPRWEWASPWHLELPDTSDEATDGWQYASSFSHFRPRPLHRARGKAMDAKSQASLPSGRHVPSSSSASASGKRLRVRRRKWVRYRRLRSGRRTLSPGPSSSAFDDAFLDSMSGWLRKRGHVRKNWKYRYFVLHKSVLRYYTDARCAKLKGEVLLFHPDTGVHYVDVHVAQGRDASFAIHVGAEYTLHLQAAQLRDRENWMYCIEDALLCRNSYHWPGHGVKGAGAVAWDLRESVARRRLLSAEVMALDGTAGGPAHEAPGATPHVARGARAGSDVLHLWASLHAKPGAVVSAVSAASATLRALLHECDAFLARPAMRDHLAAFLVVFRQKYDERVGAAGTAWTRLSEPWAPTGAWDSDSDHDWRDGSLDATSCVTTLQDARSLLALKNYRFFLERTLEVIMEHLATFVHVQTLENATGKMHEAPREDEWALARRAALYKLERRTFIPLQESIYHLLEARRGGQQEDEEHFERLRRVVASCPQQFLEIPPSHQSPSDWKAAIALLTSMDNYSLPSEKAALLVEVARSIYETHAREHEGRAGTHEHATMAADDFLPIFIFVLARCRLRSVIVARHLISETMITALMIGETGYYATMLEAAIGYIASFECNDDGGARRQGGRGTLARGSL